MRRPPPRRNETATPLVAFDGEEYLGKFRHGRLSIPVALQFADELHPTDRLAACLLQPPQPRFVCFWGCATHAICGMIDFETFTKRVERRMHEANFRPQRSEDQFLATGCFHGTDKILVFPRIDCGAV